MGISANLAVTSKDASIVELLDNLRLYRKAKFNYRLLDTEWVNLREEATPNQERSVWAKVLKARSKVYAAAKLVEQSVNRCRKQRVRIEEWIQAFEIGEYQSLLLDLKSIVIDQRKGIEEETPETEIEQP